MHQPIQKNNLDGLYHTTRAQDGEIWLAGPEPNLRSKKSL